MKNLLAPLIYSPLLVLSAPAWADEAPPSAPKPDAAAEADASNILVTATRQAVPADEVTASVTVLDKASIDRAQDLGVTELLLRTPGISMSRNGGYGGTTSLRIRGAEAEQTVVVVDGIKLNDPASPGGGYNFANLLVGDASRIEILRGPQSILWGSQAIGGVVNIVTATPKNALEGSFDVEAGSRDTVSARGALGGKNGPITWRVGGQSLTTDGISAIATGTEKDGNTNRNVAGRLEIALTDAIAIDLRGYYSNARIDIDAFNGDSLEYTLNREFVGYAGLNVSLLDGRFRNRFAYGRTSTDRDNYNPSLSFAQTFDSAGTNDRLEYQGSFALSEKWTLLFGAENERSAFRSASPSATTPNPTPATGNAEITSFYGQLNIQPVTGLTLNGGVRHDDHSRFGGKTLVGGGAVWRLPTNTIIRASYGEGFKAPTLYQLFSEFGNTGLAPEQAHGWEVGAEQRLLDDALRFGAVYFERTTTGQVIFASCFGVINDPLCVRPGTAIARFGYYINVARAEAHGIEAKASLNLSDRLILDGNYSWTVAIDRSPGTANFGKWLPRRPQNAANASISYALPFGLTIGSAVRWSGTTFDNASNATRLAPYTLVDLRAEFAVSPNFRLFARAENVFDERYVTAANYNTLGRSIYAGVRGRF